MGYQHQTLYVASQVMLSGDFVPHLAHGEVVSRPLRPPRSRGSGNNLAARGSLRFQLWLRRGGESLASEFVDSAVTVETLAVKGLPYEEGRQVNSLTVVVCFTCLWYPLCGQLFFCHFEAPCQQKSPNRSLCLSHEGLVVLLFVWPRTVFSLGGCAGRV